MGIVTAAVDMTYYIQELVVLYSYDYAMKGAINGKACNEPVEGSTQEEKCQNIYKIVGGETYQQAIFSAFSQIPLMLGFLRIQNPQGSPPGYTTLSDQNGGTDPVWFYYKGDNQEFYNW